MIRNFLRQNKKFFKKLFLLALYLKITGLCGSLPQFLFLIYLFCKVYAVLYYFLQVWRYSNVKNFLTYLNIKKLIKRNNLLLKIIIAFLFCHACLITIILLCNPTADAIISWLQVFAVSYTFVYLIVILFFKK